jgi:hypothetical protein
MGVEMSFRIDEVYIRKKAVYLAGKNRHVHLIKNRRPIIKEIYIADKINYLMRIS